MYKHKLYLPFSLVLCLLFTLSITGNAQSSDKIVYDDGLDIFVMNVDGSDIQQLTSGHNSKESRIRPDGTEIVFVSDRDGNNEIYVMDIMGNNIRRLTNNSVRDFSPSWSPDGTKIAYVSGMNADFDIYSINADGSNAINITNSIANEVYAAWSPTSDQIAFISNQSGPYEIYTMLADGSNYEHLSDAGSDRVTKLYWSPDGTRLAYYNGDDGEIYQTSADGTQEAPITFGEADIGGFFWLNNQQLIFTDTVNGWVRIDLDGSNRTVVNLDWPMPAGSFSFPPGIQIPIPPANSPPTADAGDDQMVVAANGVAAQVSLTASASDPEDEIEQLSWYQDGRQISTGLNPFQRDIELEVGVHVLTLVATDSRGLTGTDEVVIMLEASTTPEIDQPLAQINTNFEIYKLDWHPDGGVLAAASADGLTLYNEALQIVAKLYTGQTVYSLSWNPDGTQLVVTNANNLDIYEWDGTNLSLLTTLIGNNPQINVLWSPDGMRIAGVEGLAIDGGFAWDGTIKFWNAQTWLLGATASGKYEFWDSIPTVNQIAWKPNGSSELVVVGNTLYIDNGEYFIESTAQIRFIDASTGVKLREIPLRGNSLTTAVAWHPTEEQIAANFPTSMGLYDVVTGNYLGLMRTDSPAMSISWSPDGRYIIGNTRVYDIEAKKHLAYFTLPPSTGLTIVTWHPDGWRVAIGYQDGTIRIEDATLLPGFQISPTASAGNDQTLTDSLKNVP